MAIMKGLSVLVLCASYVSSQSLDEYKCNFCVGSVEEAVKTQTSLFSSCSRVFPQSVCEAFNINFNISVQLESSRGICEIEGFCEPIVRHFVGDNEHIDIRISKAHATRGYDKIRVSVISEEQIESPIFSYSDRFRYRWTENYLNTGLLSVTPGATTTFNIGSETFNVYIPAEGEGTRGVIIGDPCFTSEFVTCLYGREFDMYNHTIELLNAIHAHNDTQYWMVLGDNFYDQSGEVRVLVYVIIMLHMYFCNALYSYVYVSS